MVGCHFYNGLDGIRISPIHWSTSGLPVPDDFRNGVSLIQFVNGLKVIHRAIHRRYSSQMK